MVPIFPHESAVVTNTFSYRNDGFSYGFLLLAGVRGSSDGTWFVSIRNPTY
jgi:hypothetical protein